MKELMKKLSSVLEMGGTKKDIVLLVISGIALVCSLCGVPMPFDAADIAIAEDDIRQLPHLIALSKRMMRTIKCNLTFSMGLNFAAIILAITGLLGPVAGALVHNAGSVLVIINSAFLLKWKYKKVN